MMVRVLLLSAGVNEKSRMIRIAVNLLLILAMLLQPLAVVGFAGVASACDAQKSGLAICAGCGCCDVSQANGRCCCCQDAGAETVDPLNGPCADQAVLPVKQASSMVACLCGKRHQPLLNRCGSTTNFKLGVWTIQSLESYRCRDDSFSRGHASGVLSIAAHTALCAAISIGLVDLILGAPPVQPRCALLPRYTVVETRTLLIL